MTSDPRMLLRPAPQTTIAMPGLEADNLLAFLALLGLLRAIEESRPTWRPRASWAGPPWEARLHLDEPTDKASIALAASDGCLAIANRFDVNDQKNVKFNSAEFRSYAARLRDDPVGARLVAALSAEHPQKRGERVQAAPLVMMFGQGHQHFLERLVAVPRGELPNKMRKLKHPPDLRAPAKIAEALFAPWARTDETDAFRWDPEEDQRYALRFDDPSKAGAARTVHGANRLAAIGFLSFGCAPLSYREQAPGFFRDANGQVGFVWPLWRTPLDLRAIEALLAHPAVLRGDVAAVQLLGVLEIMRALRIANGKFINVTRAMPWRGDER